MQGQSCFILLYPFPWKLPLLPSQVHWLDQVGLWLPDTSPKATELMAWWKRWSGPLQCLLRDEKRLTFGNGNQRRRLWYSKGRGAGDHCDSHIWSEDQKEPEAEAGEWSRHLAAKTSDCGFLVRRVALAWNKFPISVPAARGAIWVKAPVLEVSISSTQILALNSPSLSHLSQKCVWGGGRRSLFLKPIYSSREGV